MTSDSELKANLIGRLDAIPAANTAEVEVVVEHGMVTLNGQVDSHQTRFQIERAARKNCRGAGFAGQHFATPWCNKNNSTLPLLNKG